MRISCQKIHLDLVEPRPFGSAPMGHRATGRLSDQPRVFRKGAGPMTRRSRCPGPTAPGKLAYRTQIELRDGETRSLPITLRDEPHAALWPWIVGGAAFLAGFGDKPPTRPGRTRLGNRRSCAPRGSARIP